MLMPTAPRRDPEPHPAVRAAGRRRAGPAVRTYRLPSIFEHGRSRLVRASVQTIAAGLLAQALLLVSGPLSARMLGVDGRGDLASLTIWPLMVTLLGNLGIPVACTFYLRERPTLAREIAGESLRISLVQSGVLTALVGGILFLVVDTRRPGLGSAALLTLLIAPSMILHRVGLAVLQGRERYTAYNVLRTLPTALYALGVAALFLRGERSLVPVIVVNVVAYAVATVATLALALRDLRPSWRTVPGLRRDLHSFGLRGHLGAVAPVDGLRIDQAAVAIFLNPTAMGLYVAAYAFTNLPRFVAESAARVAFPAVADRRDPRDGLRLVWRFFWGVTLLNLPVTAALFVAMPYLMRLFFGTEFAAAVPIARTLLVGTTLVACRRILVEGLRGLGRPTASTFAELSMYPWMIVAGPVLMAWYGAQGLALVLAIAYGLSLVVGVFAARHFTRSLLAAGRGA